jgi:hypothetical protein
MNSDRISEKKSNGQRTVSGKKKASASRPRLRAVSAPTMPKNEMTDALAACRYLHMLSYAIGGNGIALTNNDDNAILTALDHVIPELQTLQFALENAEEHRNLEMVKHVAVALTTATERVRFIRQLVNVHVKKAPAGDLIQGEYTPHAG